MNDINKLTDEELNALLSEVYAEIAEEPYSEAELDELARLQYLQNNRYPVPHEL
jgi:hypothetical protein